MGDAVYSVLPQISKLAYNTVARRQGIANAWVLRVPSGTDIYMQQSKIHLDANGAGSSTQLMEVTVRAS